MKLGLGHGGLARYRNANGATGASGAASMNMYYGLSGNAFVFCTIANALASPPTGILYAPVDDRTAGVGVGDSNLVFRNTVAEITSFDALVVNDVGSWNHFMRLNQGHWGVLAGRTVFANTTAAVTVPRLDSGAVILASIYATAAFVFPALTYHWVPADQRNPGAGTFTVQSTQDITGAFAEWVVINDVGGIWDMAIPGV